MSNANLFRCILLITLSLHAHPEQYQWNENEQEGDDFKPAQEDIIFRGPHDYAPAWTTTTSRTTTIASPCKFEQMIQCLFEPLDEWAMVLYALKENIVAISGKHCSTTRDMIRRCVEEHAIQQYECDQNDILRVAARVTDLLMHKKNSGNLLRSYYVTAYVCTPEGQLLRNRISDPCLLQEHIGELTFDAMKYIDENLQANRTATAQDRCAFLRQRAHFMRDVGNHKCALHEPDDAGLLMCETLKLALQKMHPDTFGRGQCEFTCRSDQNDHPSRVGGDDGHGGGQSTDSEYMSAATDNRATGLVHSLAIVSFILAIRLRFMA